LIDRARVDERFITLDVDDDVAVERGDHLGETIGAGQMRGFCQPDFAAEIAHARRDTQIVGGDDDLRHGGSGRGAAVDVFDHRTAVDIGERLAGKTRRGESSGDDSDDLQWIR